MIPDWIWVCCSGLLKKQRPVLFKFTLFKLIAVDNWLEHTLSVRWFDAESKCSESCIQVYHVLQIGTRLNA